MKGSTVTNRLCASFGMLLSLLSAAVVHADGGIVCLSERKGNYHITVFTAPTPVRVGLVDMSVFVQIAATGEPDLGARVRIRAVPRGRPDAAIEQTATNEQATNKLFQAAVFDLPESGWWDVALLLDGLGEPIELSFAMEVEDALPRFWQLVPWIAWTGAAIFLFLIHQGLVRRKEAIKKANSHK